MTIEKQIVIVRSNPISPNPRVEKIARVLHQVGWSVMILGWDRYVSLPKMEKRNYAVLYRIAIPAGFGRGARNLFPLIIWQIKLFSWLLCHMASYTHIHACDFDTIIPAFLMKVLFRKKVVYDICDFYTDVHSDLYGILRATLRKIDFWLIGKVDAVIIVDDARQEQIRGTYPKRLQVIYNSPEQFYGIEEADEQKHSPDTLRIVFVGVLSVTRGLLEAFEVLDRHPNWKMELAGYGGDDASQIIRAAKTRQNLIFRGKISYEEALRISSYADVLFATYDPAILNHRYSSANKLFEAMMLGKPIIVARNTNMDKIVLKHGLGFVVKYGDIEELDQAFKIIASWNSEQKRNFSSHVRHVFHQNYDWNLMREKLKELYASI